MTALTSSPFWPVPIVAYGRSRGGTVVFRRAGKLHVTCVLKSTFQLVPDAPMKLVEAEEIVISDALFPDSSAWSVRAPSEVVPFLPRVDVLLTGHACAPFGQPVTSHAVRLAIHRNDGCLLNKTLHVYGDRMGATMVPFDRIPIVYERTYGGAGYSLNPHGTGMTPGSSFPNIVHPSGAGIVGGFGPLSFDMRMSRLSAMVHPEVIDDQVLDVPLQFDDAYYQSAPSDQLLDSLQGNEWIEVDGVHPQHQRLVSRLPGVRAVAKLFGVHPERPEGVRTISLRLDMLRIDADTLQCSVIFRAIIGIRDARSLQTLRIAAGLETDDGSVAHLLTAPPMRGAELPQPDDNEVTGQVVPSQMNAARNPRQSVTDEVTTLHTLEVTDAVKKLRQASNEEATTLYVLEATNAVENPRQSSNEEATTLYTLDMMTKRNAKPARISIPEIEVLDDETATVERPRTKAEMDRIAAIAAHLENLPMPDSSSMREEKSTLSLDIDLSAFNLNDFDPS